MFGITLRKTFTSILLAAALLCFGPAALAAPADAPSRASSAWAELLDVLQYALASLLPDGEAEVTPATNADDPTTPKEDVDHAQNIDPLG